VGGSSSPLILTSKGRKDSSQKLSTMKVSAINLAKFASTYDLLRWGTPLCGKVVTENKDIFAFDLFFLFGPFALSNVAFYSGGFLNIIRFVAKPTKCKNDNLLKLTFHITLAKSKY
jgi:hypothetical protein